MPPICHFHLEDDVITRTSSHELEPGAFSWPDPAVQTHRDACSQTASHPLLGRLQSPSPTITPAGPPLFSTHMALAPALSPHLALLSHVKPSLPQPLTSSIRHPCVDAPAGHPVTAQSPRQAQKVRETVFGLDLQNPRLFLTLAAHTDDCPLKLGSLQMLQAFPGTSHHASQAPGGRT